MEKGVEGYLPEKGMDDKASPSDFFRQTCDRIRRWRMKNAVSLSDAILWMLDGSLGSLLQSRMGRDGI